MLIDLGYRWPRWKRIAKGRNLRLGHLKLIPRHLSSSYSRRHITVYKGISLTEFLFSGKFPGEEPFHFIFHHNVQFFRTKEKRPFPPPSASPLLAQGDFCARSPARLTPTEMRVLVFFRKLWYIYFLTPLHSAIPRFTLSRPVPSRPYTHSPL